MAHDEPSPPTRRTRGWVGAETQAMYAQPAGKQAKRQRQLFLLIAGILALVGAIGALLLLVIDRGPRLFYLNIPITEYRERFYPANAWAEQDGRTLQQIFAPGRPSDGASTVAYESQSKGPLLQQLEALAGRREPTVVLHLSALARGHQGAVYLLPADASPDQPDTWVPLDQVLEALRSCPASHKLLLLDLGRPLADSRLGVLADDVGSQVHDQLTRLDQEGKLPFAVLTACQRNETTQVWEERKQSAFGYFLAEGLRGFADGAAAQQKSRDRRVTVHELADYVTAKVPEWTVRHRNAAQTPRLYGKSADFPLDECDEPVASELPAPDVYPDWLAAGWQQRDRWRAAGGPRLSPRLFRQLEVAVLRAEQRWRGGVGDPQRIQKELTADLQALQEHFQRAQEAVRRPAPRTLALEVALGAQPDASVKADLKTLLGQLADGTGGKPDEDSKQRQKLLGDFAKKHQDKPSFDLAWAAFDLAAGDDLPTPERVRLLDRIVQGQQARPRYVETLFLQRVAGVAADEGRKWYPEVVRWALRTVQLGERAAAVDPALLPWVRPLLDEAAEKREQGEAILIEGGPPSKMKQAQELLQAAEARYQDIDGLVVALEDAAQRLAEARVLLPGFAPYLPARPHFDSGLERDWLAAAETTGRLSELLAQPANQPLNKLSEVQRLSAELRRSLANLQQPFGPEALQQLIKQASQNDVAQYLEMQALLESPCLTAPQRKDLWTARQDLGRRLAKKSLPPAPLEHERAALRARLALHWLKLSAADLDKLDADIRAQANQPSARARWEKLGDDVRQALAVDLPKLWKERTAAQDLPGLSRLEFLLDPNDFLGDESRTSAAVRQRRRDVRAYYSWLADSYRRQSQQAGGAGTTFFAETAAEYRTFAE
ncbi:MAG: hypothetical protein JNM56_09490 [Planctomycetia bacterium]|nr:hypothetical protein [Planctomycetia bacterium]